MTDIKLDQEGGHWVVVDAGALKVAGTDLMLDSPERRGSNRGGHRRALVHDFNDGLTINYNRDYTGGVTIENARVRLRVNSGPKLPKEGRVGELYLMQTSQDLHVMGVSTSLWLCLGTGISAAALIDGAVTWQEIPLGKTKRGG
jgi:hypothetical protein